MLQYELVSTVLRRLIPDDAEWESIYHLASWIGIFQQEWEEGNIELLLRVPGQALPQVIPCLGRKLTFELDHNARFIHCVIRSDPLDHDQFADPFILNRHVDYLKCKYAPATKGEDESERKNESATDPDSDAINEGKGENATDPDSDAINEGKDESATHPGSDANSEHGRRTVSADSSVQEDAKADPSDPQPVPKLTPAQLRTLSPEETEQRHKQARNYRKTAMAQIIAEGKEPTKSNYSEAVFVNDVRERCGLHSSEVVRGFHRTTLRKIF